MSKDYFIQLFEYDGSANQQTHDLLSKTSQTPKRVYQIFAHILATKKIWLARLKGESSADIAIWPSHSLESCAKLIKENRQGYRNYLNSKTDIELVKDVIYKNSKEIQFNTPANDILMHVLFHGNYHRGQIAVAIKNCSGEPINTDYINYLR